MNPIPLFIFGFLALILSGVAGHYEVGHATTTWLAAATVLYAIGFAVLLKLK